MSKCIRATSSNIDRILKDGVVLLEFWAPWARSCAVIAHVIEEIAEDFDGKATVLKVNTDDLCDIAIKHKIRFVPTVIVFKNGKEVSRDFGEASKESFVKMINNAIKGD